MTEKRKSGIDRILEEDEFISILHALKLGEKHDIPLNQSKLQYIFNVERDKEGETNVAFISKENGEFNQYKIHDNKTKKIGEKFGDDKDKKVKKSSDEYVQEHKLLDDFRNSIENRFGKEILDSFSEKSQKSFYNKIKKLENNELIERSGHGKYPYLKLTQSSNELLVKEHHIDRLELLGPDKISRDIERWTVYDFPEREDSKVISEFKECTEDLLREFDQKYFELWSELNSYLIPEIKEIYDQKIDELEEGKTKELNDDLFQKVVRDIFKLLDKSWSEGYKVRSDANLDLDHEVDDISKKIRIEVIKDMDSELIEEIIDLIELINNPMFVYTPLSYEEEVKLALDENFENLDFEILQ